MTIASPGSANEAREKERLVGLLISSGLNRPDSQMVVDMALHACHEMQRVAMRVLDPMPDDIRPCGVMLAFNMIADVAKFTQDSLATDATFRLMKGEYR